MDGLENTNYNLVSSRNSKGEPVLVIVEDSKTNIGFFQSLLNANLGISGEGGEIHSLYFNGTQIAQFCSFQDLKTIAHGKSVAELIEIGRNNISDGIDRMMALHALAESMREHHNAVNYGRNAVQNSQLYDDAQNEAISVARPTTPNGVTNKQTAAIHANKNSAKSNLAVIKPAQVQTPGQLQQANAGDGGIQKLRIQFDELAESKLLPQFRLEDPNLKAGYTGSFKTGVVSNRNKSTFGQPINLASFDIDFWIESDILFKKYGRYLRPNREFRKLLSQTPGFEGLHPNNKGFSIKFRPSRKK